MDSRKLDMIFFMALENSGKELSFDELNKIAEKYSAKSLWKLWQHTKRRKNYIKRTRKA